MIPEPCLEPLWLDTFACGLSEYTTDTSHPHGNDAVSHDGENEAERALLSEPPALTAELNCLSTSKKCQSIHRLQFAKAVSGLV